MPQVVSFNERCPSWVVLVLSMSVRMHGNPGATGDITSGIVRGNDG